MQKTPAFVPVFSELLEKGERKRAWRVASTLFWLMLLALGGLTALFILIAPYVLRLFGDPGEVGAVDALAEPTGLVAAVGDDGPAPGSGPVGVGAR